MDFVTGVACWHVVGYDLLDTGAPLCGYLPDEDAIVGDVYEFLQNMLPLCQRCNRCTSGEAGRYVNAIGNALVEQGAI